MLLGKTILVPFEALVAPRIQITLALESHMLNKGHELFSDRQHSN